MYVLYLLHPECTITAVPPESILSGVTNLEYVKPHNRSAPGTHDWVVATGPDADKPSTNDAELAALHAKFTIDVKPVQFFLGNNITET